MQAQLSEERRMLVEALAGSVRRVSPVERVQALDNAKTFDAELHRALADIGIMGLGVAEEEGGSGGGATEQMLALETLGNLATSMAVFTVVQFMATRLLREYGSPEQKARWLAPLARGDIKCSFSLTEAGGGTDVLSAMRTRAKKQGDGWVLSGEKMWISGATQADLVIAVARTSEHRSRGITLFLVPTDAKGFSATAIDTVAINGYDTCAVSFDEVALPENAVLGRVDEGFSHVVATLNGERLNCAGVATGIARGAWQAALDYAKEREAFGGRIGRFQALQHRLVQAGIAIESGWLLALRAAEEDEAGRPADIAASMAKYAASQAALQATHIGMEIMGGAGFDMRSPMQRWFRDARLYVFAPHTNDMSLNYLGERWLGLPRSF